MKRRTFIRSTALMGVAGAAAVARSSGVRPDEMVQVLQLQDAATSPVVACTWDFGEVVPRTAYDILAKNGTLLDAVEQAVWIPEADPNVNSVGRGGYPDRDGHVTLDACIMDGNGNCGSVVFLEKVLHPVSVARAVMERTSHVMLAGAGALQFAKTQGFLEEELLTPDARRAYGEWLKSGVYKPASALNHDTIGLLALDGKGQMAGACTTSGMAWKVRGRVGDSAIIGAGLFVDNEAGAATATGIGEAVIKIAGSHAIVEMLKQGRSPQEACRLAVTRILDKQPSYRKEESFLVGFLAMDRSGNVGGCSYRKGFQYAVVRDGRHSVVDAEHLA